MNQDRNKKGITAICPACDSPIYFKKRLGNGQMVVCRECDSLLQVKSTSPLKLTWAFQDPIDDLFHDRRESESYQEWEEQEDDYDEFDDYGRERRKGRGNNRARRYD